MEIITELNEGVFGLQMNRPDRKNALTLAMHSEMASAVASADGDPAVRVILAHGRPDVLGSGDHLGDFLHSPPPAKGSPMLTFISAISSASKPIVAAVFGLAMGIGIAMLFHVEQVYAVESTRVQLPFVNLAPPPEAADKLAAKPLAALRLAKSLMKQAGAEALAVQTAGFAEQLRSPEAAEAMKAFFKKRPPNFAQFA